MHYRLYFLDANDRFRAAVDLDCQDDEEAAALAEAQADRRTRELWQGARLVRRFGAAEPDPRPAS